MNFLRTLVAFGTGLIAAVFLIPILIGIGFFKAMAVLTKNLARRLEPAYLNWQDLIEFYPTIGWRSKSNLNTHALVDDLFYFTTDADGWRGNNLTLSESEIVVFGDSHAFGYGINEKDFFANVEPELRVKSVGVISYNLVQEVLWMRELASSLRNKVVVWFVFLGNDLLDNLEPSQYHYRNPFIREIDGTSQWEIVTNHVTPEPWPFISRRWLQTNYDRLTKIYSPCFVADRAFAACEHLINEAAQICQDAGARLVVVTIPDPTPLNPERMKELYKHGADPKLFDPELPDKRIRAICDKLGVEFTPGTEFLGAGDYKEFDDHWNANGHRQVAKLLKGLRSAPGRIRQAKRVDGEAIRVNKNTQLDGATVTK